MNTVTLDSSQHGTFVVNSDHVASILEAREGYAWTVMHGEAEMRTGVKLSPTLTRLDLAIIISSVSGGSVA